MPTQEFADLVSVVEESLEQLLATDPMMLPDTDQTASATFTGGPAHAYVLDFEKIIWHYPDAMARIIEEVA
jgi:hypothetical protein